MSKFIRFCWVLLLGNLIAPGLYAQETTSDIQGRISDGTTGLAGATVIALHGPTGTQYATTTRKDGRFNLPNLRVGGPYTVTVTYAGYQEEKQENVTLVLGQTFFADFSLKPETKELQELVLTGTRQDKVFSTSHTGPQELITRTQIEQLPTINRSFSDFTKLEPSSEGLSFAGTNPGENNITLDGADFNNSFGLASTLGGQADAQPIALDAIDQIQVSISPYDVREGGFTGAGINAVSRGGTNTFRGSIYDYERGPGTIGYHADNSIVAKTPFTYYILGGSLGGPIIKNRLFFFVNLEEDIESAPATTIVASTASNPPVAGLVSQANADTLNALRQFLITNYKYDPGSFEGYNFATNSYKADARLDFNIDRHNTLTLKYNYLKSYADQFASTSRSDGPSGQITGGQPGTFSMPFEGSGYRINNDLKIYQAELDTRFGNSASNKVQLGYTQERDFRSPQSSSSNFPLVDILDNGNIYTTFGYEPFTYNNTLDMDSYNLEEVFSLFRGAHEINIGSQDSYKKYQNAFAPGWNGIYQFASLDQFLNGGTAQTYTQDYSTLPGAAFPWAYAGAFNGSLFIQDKFRATPTFTLLYGIRGDYTSYQNKFTDNPNFDALQFLNGAQYNVGKAPNGFFVVSPRVGFNWDITGDKTWQLRGGAGVFEGAPPFVWIENQAANNGVQLGSFKEANAPFYPTAQAGLNNYLTSQNIVQTNTPLSYSVDITDKHFKYPTELRSNIGLDKKLADGWVITGEFTFTKAIQATYMENINLNESNGFAISNGGDTRERYLTTAGSNAYHSGAGGATLQNPTLGTSILLANTHKGYGYQATFRVQKQFKHLYLSAAYNYNQSWTTMENGSTAGTLWASRAVANTDPNAPTLGHPDWYQPQRIIAYGNYRFEYAKHLATSIGVEFEAVPSSTTSYVYNGDLNGDGNTGNDLIYIPKSATDINLIDVGSYNAVTAPNGVTGGTVADPRTAAQIWAQLNDFIQQDHYLDHHRGQYAQANAVIDPWFKHMDLNVTEDIYFFTGHDENKTRHTLRLSMDLIDVGNFLNRNWGLERFSTISNFLKFEGIAADGKTALFSFPYEDATNKIPLVNSFQYSTSVRWEAQFGVRYLFN